MRPHRRDRPRGALAASTVKWIYLAERTILLGVSVPQKPIIAIALALSAGCTPSTARSLAGGDIRVGCAVRSDSATAAVSASLGCAREEALLPLLLGESDRLLARVSSKETALSPYVQASQLRDGKETTSEGYTALVSSGAPLALGLQRSGATRWVDVGMPAPPDLSLSGAERRTVQHGALCRAGGGRVSTEGQVRPSSWKG